MSPFVTDCPDKDVPAVRKVTGTPDLRLYSKSFRTSISFFGRITASGTKRYTLASRLYANRSTQLSPTRSRGKYSKISGIYKGRQLSRMMSGTGIVLSFI